MVGCKEAGRGFGQLECVKNVQGQVCKVIYRICKERSYTFIFLVLLSFLCMQLSVAEWLILAECSPCP